MRSWPDARRRSGHRASDKTEDSNLVDEMARDNRNLKHWPKRLPAALEPPAVSLWDNLADNARRYPDRTALKFFGCRISYRELAGMAERLAGRLRDLGVERGARVLVLMQNCPQLVIAHFAIMRADAVVVPINPMNRADELRHYIVDAEAKVAITTSDLAAELAKASDSTERGHGLQHLIVSDFADMLGVEDNASIPPVWREWLTAKHPDVTLSGGSVNRWTDAVACPSSPGASATGAEDLALLPYTSGTTGLPKGCMLTHANLMHNAVTTAIWLDMTPGTVSLSVLPFFHITGLVCVMHATILMGGTLVIMPRWDREVAAEAISREQVTHWLSIPTMIIDLLGSPRIADFDLGSLVHVGGGGSAMPEAVAERLWEQLGLRFVEGYGLTESSAVTLMNPCDAPRLQCLGIPFISVDARVIDIDTGAEAAVGDEGEIVVSGPQVFQGYWKHPRATSDATIQIDGKRFLRTGDIGYRDQDGYFFMTDRLKRMINASGYKVWPAEIESLMFRHPGIQEVCVIAATDAYRGETVKAVVVRKPSDVHLTDEQVIAWCRTQVSAYKVPRIVEFVDRLPKSASGKVMWRELQAAEADKT